MIKRNRPTQQRAVIPQTVPQPPAVFCKDCAHYTQRKYALDGPYVARCRRPLGISLVAGTMAYTDLDCERERILPRTEGFCGREGSLFVQRDTSED